MIAINMCFFLLSAVRKKKFMLHRNKVSLSPPLVETGR